MLTKTSVYVAANVIACAEDKTGRLVGFYALERNRAVSDWKISF